MGLDSQLIIPPLLQMLHDLIPSHSNMFAWVEDFELTNLYAEESIPPELIHLYLTEFYNKREAEVCPPFSLAARLERGITDWEQYLASEQFSQSEFYNRIMRPQHIRYILRAYIVVNGRTAGLLVLQRQSGDMPFSKIDKSLLARIVPYISHALKGQVSYPASFGMAWKTGLILLNPYCQVVGADPRGQQLLLLAGNAKINTSTVNKSPYTEVPYALRELCMRNMAKFSGHPKQEIAMQIQNGWGIFSFNTYMLVPGKLPEPVVGVTLSQHLPRQVRLIQSMKTSPLSGKQKEVCLWLLEGFSQQDIALKMGISPHSVNDYLKAAYRKLEVHSKDELLRKLLSEATSTPV